MSRITKTQKAIMTAHIEAANKDIFDYDTAMDAPFEVGWLTTGLREGKTFRFLHEDIETRHVPVGTLLINSVFDHKSKTYISGMSKGWKSILNAMNIK